MLSAGRKRGSLITLLGYPRSRSGIHGAELQTYRNVCVKFVRRLHTAAAVCKQFAMVLARFCNKSIVRSVTTVLCRVLFSPPRNLLKLIKIVEALERWIACMKANVPQFSLSTVVHLSKNAAVSTASRDLDIDSACDLIEVARKILRRPWETDAVGSSAETSSTRKRRAPAVAWNIL